MKLHTAISFLTLLYCSSSVEGARSTTPHRRAKAKSGKAKSQKKKSSGGPLYSLLTNPATGLQVITTVNFNPDDSALIHIAGTTGYSGCSAPDEGAGDCTIAIKESCEGMNLYHSYMSADPWTGEVNYFTTDDATTETKSAFMLNYGIGYDETEGSAIVVSVPGETPWCGYLMKSPAKFTSLMADVGTYPEYSGSKDYTPTGTIGLTYGIDGTFTYKFDVEDLESNCEGCGIHVHAGVSCDSHEQVKGHGWNQDFVVDLWTAAGGAVYATDDDGKASGEFKLYNGFDIFSNMNHAVVIHAQDGARLGCGVLKLVV
mmetsp:Transcript_31754/g.46838  ORF Transcript_31754/g.46838 Transcript_31754/m.46838 type:complete len:315 (-) Transcript_31754:85-1029(-)